ncbi:hypothetical protein DRP05_14330 [Archaeoglobales archaeon]|mgnify:CR=1 FL=1|nr:MAG: hypothetical protein DRP05_14330 [Archaeoglobales archaeon]
MKIKKDFKIVRNLCISISIIFVGLVLTLLTNIFVLGSAVIIGGLTLLASSIYTATKPEIETILDERVERINEKAANHAFYITLLLISTIYLASLCNLIENLKEALRVTLFVGLITWIVLRFYFSKRSLE